MKTLRRTALLAIGVLSLTLSFSLLPWWHAIVGIALLGFFVADD